MTRLFLRKTPPEKLAENPRLPYFQLVIPPEEGSDEWITIGAFWKAQSGNGYSGKTDDGVVLDYSAVNPAPTRQAPAGNQEAVAPAAQGVGQSAPAATPAPTPTQRPNYDDEITPEDIPFD